MKRLLPLPTILVLTLLTHGATGEPPGVPSESDPVYLLRLANQRMLLVSELTVDPDRETVVCRGRISGLRAAFPLDRLHQVVAVQKGQQGPELGSVLYTNPDSILTYPEYGGIPADFYVTSSSVGYSGSVATSGRSSSRAGTSRSSRSTSRSRPTTSRASRSSSSSSSSSSRDSSAARNPFAEIFGGR